MFGQRSHDTIIDPVLHQNAARLGTVLTGIKETTTTDGFDHRIQVGIVKHNYRRFAAQFQMHMANLLGRGPHCGHPSRGTSGDADPLNPWMINQCITNTSAIPMDHVDHTRWHNVIDQLCCPQSGQGRQLAWFEDNRATRGQWGRQFPSGHHQGVVPGRDTRNRADRILADHAGKTLNILACRTALLGARRARHKTKGVNGEWHFIIMSTWPRLAAIHAFQFSQFLAVLFQLVCNGK